MTTMVTAVTPVETAVTETAMTTTAVTTTAVATASATDARVFSARHDYTAAVPTIAPKNGAPLSLRPM
jgi:hypothetical protein